MPTRTIRSLDKLAEAILSLNRNCLIGIDGMDGSGKSYLAERLALRLKAVHINLDEFLNRNEGGFLGHLRYEELQVATGAGLRAGRVIVEGDCLRSVFDRLGLEADVHVYVKHVVDDDLWLDGIFLHLADSAEQVLAIKQKEAERFAEVCGDTVELGQDLVTGLYRELVTYHFAYRPHERADLVFERE